MFDTYTKSWLNSFSYTWDLTLLSINKRKKSEAEFYQKKYTYIFISPRRKTQIHLYPYAAYKAPAGVSVHRQFETFISICSLIRFSCLFSFSLLSHVQTLYFFVVYFSHFKSFLPALYRVNDRGGKKMIFFALLLLPKSFFEILLSATTSLYSWSEQNHEQWFESIYPKIAYMQSWTSTWDGKKIAFCSKNIHI